MRIYLKVQMLGKVGAINRLIQMGVHLGVSNQGKVGIINGVI